MAARLDPYATLGIPSNASRADAARAHRRLAKRFHPDRNAGPEAAERMRRINEAWHVVSDPSRRARYDAGRVASSSPHGAYGPSPGRASWAGYGYGYGERSETTWTSWPESRSAPTPRPRRPARPEPVAPPLGDRPIVFVAVWVGITLLYVVGAWLGSIAP